MNIVWGIVSGTSLENSEPQYSPKSDDGISSTRLFIILFGSAAVLYSGAILLKHIYPIFDDIHDSDSESEEDKDEIGT